MAKAALFKVSLMVVFCGVEFRGLGDLGGDGAAGLRLPLYRLFSCSALAFVLEEDTGSVLGANVGTLAVMRRVVHLKEGVEQGAVVDFVVVKDDADGFG